MGINPTQPNHKAFTFDGTSSRNYGVYITGEAVFNAPQRDVQMVDIPGRNGAYALDKGNFNNITVKYPASIVADNETDFAEAVSELRNFLCSKTGYCRLEDEYNPDEYRMAIYKSGLEVEHDMLTAGEFDITFECKPQRWLKSGETAVAVADGGTLDNPTPFEAEPLLLVQGTGNVTINSDTIQLNVQQLGLGVVGSSSVDIDTKGVTYTITNTDYYNIGDTLSIAPLYWLITYYSNKSDLVTITSKTLSSESGSGYYGNDYNEIGFCKDEQLTFTSGTASTKTYTITINIQYVYGPKQSQQTGSGTATFVCTAMYDGSDTVVCSCSMSQSIGSKVTPQFSTRYDWDYGLSNSIQADSTKTVGTIYIDLDIGEAYAITDGTYTSLNDSVLIGAKLPTLKSGINTFTYDNTVTNFKVVPRWWIV